MARWVLNYYINKEEKVQYLYRDGVRYVRTGGARAATATCTSPAPCT